MVSRANHARLIVVTSHDDRRPPLRFASRFQLSTFYFSGRKYFIDSLTAVARVARRTSSDRT